MRDFNSKGFTQFREDFNNLPVKKNNEDDKLEISNEQRKNFDETMKNAPQGTTIQTVPKQKGGQLYLYRNGGLPRFQGPDISQVLAKPKIDPNLVYNTQQYNKEYDLPQETLDITETTKPNFLQGVARAMPYMNFANNMYDRISAENQRNKLRQQATSIEGIASPISDYKGRFSEYGAYQPNLQGFQGIGSAKYGGVIGNGEYYLSDSEIQDIISMGGEVEFLED